MLETTQIQSSGRHSTDASHVDADFSFALRVEALGAGARTEVARIEGGAHARIARKGQRGMGVWPFLRLGLAVTGPSGPCEIAYDDVTYDAR